MKFDADGYETRCIGSYYAARNPPGVMEEYKIYSSIVDKLRFYEVVRDPLLLVTISVREISDIEAEELIITHAAREPKIFHEKLQKVIEFCNNPHITTKEKIKKLRKEL